MLFCSYLEVNVNNVNETTATSAACTSSNYEHNSNLMRTS